MEDSSLYTYPRSAATSSLRIFYKTLISSSFWESLASMVLYCSIFDVFYCFNLSVSANSALSSSCNRHTSFSIQLYFLMTISLGLKTISVLLMFFVVLAEQVNLMFGLLREIDRGLLIWVFFLLSFSLSNGLPTKSSAIRTAEGEAAVYTEDSAFCPDTPNEIRLADYSLFEKSFLGVGFVGRGVEAGPRSKSSSTMVKSLQGVERVRLRVKSLGFISNWHSFLVSLFRSKPQQDERGSRLACLLGVTLRIILFYQQFQSETPSPNTYCAPLNYQVEVGPLYFYRHNARYGLMRQTIISIPLNRAMSLRNFSYTADLEKAAQGSKWNDTLSEVRTVQPEIYDSIDISAHTFTLDHTLTALLEFENVLYYFILSDDTSTEKQPEFSLTITSILKSNGYNYKTTITGLKGTPKCIIATFMTIPKEKGSEEEKYKVVALVGLEEGFIKVVQLVQYKEKPRAEVDSHKIEQKPMISIMSCRPHHYNRKNICFLLLQDSKVFIYNYLSKQVVAIFQPPVLSHDFAICMTLHHSGLNVATATKSGQIFFWELNPPVLEAIQRSENKAKRKSDAKRGEEEEETEWQFSAKDRAINVFPMNALHSASIHGLKWISFYGDLLALVSRRGLFRLIAVNFPLRDEYLNLIQYQIQEGEAISSIQIFPQLQTLVVTKCRQYESLLTEEESKSRTGSEVSKKTSTSTKPTSYNARMNGNCYGSKTIAECVLQKVKFGNDLRVQSVQRARVVDSVSKQQIDFTYSIVSGACNYLLVGNKERYCVALCHQFFRVDR